MYSEIDPLHLPEVLELVDRHHGQGELYVALKSTIAGVITAVNRKQSLKEQSAYYRAKMVEYKAKIAECRTKAEEVEAELTAIEARRCMMNWILGLSLAAAKGVASESIFTPRTSFTSRHGQQCHTGFKIISNNYNNAWKLEA